MSVIAPYNEAPEAEALARAQRAHEPSMEEILASIRAIIADDSAPVKPGPQLVYAADAQVRAPEAGDVSKPLLDASRSFGDTPSSAQSKDTAPIEDEALLSEDSSEAVAGSFRALAESMAAQSAKAAEEMAREMLRPMLRAWLDENMPPMVERLVKAEIQRLARGGR